MLPLGLPGGSRELRLRLPAASIPREAIGAEERNHGRSMRAARAFDSELRLKASPGVHIAFRPSAVEALDDKALLDGEIVSEDELRGAR